MNFWLKRLNFMMQIKFARNSSGFSRISCHVISKHFPKNPQNAAKEIFTNLRATKFRPPFLAQSCQDLFFENLSIFNACRQILMPKGRVVFSKKQKRKRMEFWEIFEAWFYRKIMRQNFRRHRRAFVNLIQHFFHIIHSFPLAGFKTWNNDKMMS